MSSRSDVAMVSPDRDTTSPGWAKSLAIRYLAAQVVVFLFFSPYLAYLSTDHIRNTRYWQASDTATIAVCIGLLTLGCVLLSEIVRLVNRPFLTTLFNHCFVLGLGLGAITSFQYQFYYWRPPVFSKIAWRLWAHSGVIASVTTVVMMAVVAYSLARRRSGLVRRSKQVCLIISLVPFAVIHYMFQLATYPARMDPRPSPVVRDSRPQASLVRAAAASDDSHPIYLFVFDAWSYQRTFSNGRPRPEFEHLSALCEQSMVFHEARSTGPYTGVSIPGLLFQTDLPVIRLRSDGRVGFERDGRFVDASEFDSLFSVVSGLGYDTFLSGVKVPYRTWLGNRVDVCRQYRWYDTGFGFSRRMAAHALDSTRYWRPPGIVALDDSHRPYEGLSVSNIRREQKRDIFHVVETQRKATFAIFHLVIPHFPALRNADGTHRGPSELGWDSTSIPDYRGNLAHLDELIGEIVTAAKRVGRFDDAMIILTSDHTWRYDPARDTGEITCPNTHVPLIVKLPNQKRNLPVTGQFTNSKLGALIAWALQSDGNSDDAARFLTSRLGVGVMSDSLSSSDESASPTERQDAGGPTRTTGPAEAESGVVFAQAR
ncbi:MAG: sulfatase-like hydrolase/transferase [Planctomycetes bacterium]|nr:sulfatase-like hydrolase/transferase [Planctomycetota bacterium]